MDSVYSGPERRRFKRLKVSFIVFYKVNSPLKVRMLIGDKEVHAIMLDLSEAGMAVITNCNISALTLLSIRFILVNENAIVEGQRIRSMQMNGEVRYNILWKGAYRLGISFTEISEEDKAAIANLVKMAIKP